MSAIAFTPLAFSTASSTRTSLAVSLLSLAIVSSGGGASGTVFFSTVASALPFINNKLLKPLAVISDNRSSLVPDVPSTSELGLKNYAAATWFGLFAPADTPADIIARLQGAVQAMLNDAATKEKFVALGIEAAPADYSAAALTQRIEIELSSWSEIIRAANITIK
jgi:tripartite-type tricarboxylate transporter receptor subunit TctC